MNEEYFMLMVFIGCVFGIFAFATMIEALFMFFMPNLYKRVVFKDYKP